MVWVLATQDALLRIQSAMDRINGMFRPLVMRILMKLIGNWKSAQVNLLYPL